MCEYRISRNFELGETEVQSLIRAAIAARDKAYAPYSEFKVGAALLCSDGRVFCGCNVENAAYGAGICAERGAGMQALAEGARDFSAIAVVGWRDGNEEQERGLSYPCGICRQFLNEFTDGRMRVYVARSTTDYEENDLASLLPHSFGPQNLDD
ncbi:MAG TPA: cytidine deaminase [Fastidiosipila sp.]|nr:cytidine deaminase [Fastidiosipila sp.]